MASRNTALYMHVLLALALGGCTEREGRPIAPCIRVNLSLSIAYDTTDKVDLLLLIDNSNSMTEEQASLARELPNMMSILASGDFEQDGNIAGPEDFMPVRDLNVGVITSDMGTGGFSVPTCLSSDFGDDGVLRTIGNTAIDGCAATYPAILNFMPPDDPTLYAADVGCVATVGTGGCGFEQQLEAILKAITPTAPQPWTSQDFVAIGTPFAPNGLDRPFFRNSPPHGDRENAGFARENAVLAIIPVTDEEDCSAHDEELFNPAGGPYASVDLNLRCFTFPEALHPIERYVAGLIQLRPRPGLLIYAPIVGIPLDLVPPPGESPTWDLLVGDPLVRDDRMEERVDGTMPRRLVPSCDVPDRGVAFPPVRMVRVAQELQYAGANVTVQSICQDSFSGALREIIRQVSSALDTAACLPRPLNLRENGTVDCNMVAALPAGMSCDDIGASPHPEPPAWDDRTTCVLTQLVPTPPEVPTGDHWYYDTFSDEGRMACLDSWDPSRTFQRIAFTGYIPSGAEIRLECFSPVENGSDFGLFCDPDGADVCSGGTTEAGAALACDPLARSCGVPCATDVDCRHAGLVGFACDLRTLETIAPETHAGDRTQRAFCVNPTCG